MNHSFNTDVAKELGLHEAILLENIFHWCRHSETNRKNYHDGKYWTYNSTRAFSEQFEYMSSGQIERAIKTLKDHGLIEIGNYNSNLYDRTRWFSVTEKAYSIYQIQQIHSPSVTNGFTTNDEPIPDINQYNNQYNHVGSSIEDKCPDKYPTDKETKQSLFNQFWKAYPKKKNKAYSEQKFKKIPHISSEFEHIMYSLEKFKKTKDWIKDDGQYIPDPSTWLNQKRWLDFEMEPEKGDEYIPPEQVQEVQPLPVFTEEQERMYKEAMRGNINYDYTTGNS